MRTETFDVILESGEVLGAVTELCCVHSARLRGQERNPYLWQDALRRLCQTNYLSGTRTSAGINLRCWA